MTWEELVVEIAKLALPELTLLDEQVHALLAKFETSERTREQQVAATRAIDEAVVDQLERATVTKP